MRYFIKLSYLGAPFHGWQIQPNAISVQQRLEEALSTVLRERIQVTGAGRTDTGVNARVMYAHFDTDVPADKVLSSIRGVNLLCGHDISVSHIFPMADDAHARFDATRRTYKYFVTYQKNPFFRHLSWLSPARLDIEKMNNAAELLLDTDDFTSFAKLHGNSRTNICDVDKAVWTPLRDDDDSIVFTISANRFLRNMVRAVTGTLVDVGRGKISIEEFAEIIASKNRCSASVSMPAEALFLWNIEYPYPLEEKML